MSISTLFLYKISHESHSLWVCGITVNNMQYTLYNIKISMQPIVVWISNLQYPKIMEDLKLDSWFLSAKWIFFNWLDLSILVNIVKQTNYISKIKNNFLDIFDKCKLVWFRSPFPIYLGIYILKEYFNTTITVSRSVEPPFPWKIQSY